ncbi:MAG TPA: tetratricopeptide repeat protein, partial [Gemmataceae bacterium]|nr:tetratricopeptide repeat protein [Gemmataceae bacterium]
SLELLLAAHAQHPDDFWINYDLAYAHLHTTPPQWDESLRHYTAALALRPRSHVLYLNIGVVRMSQGKNAAAMTAFMKSVELKPDFAPAHNNIGIVLTKDGKYDQAEAALQQAIDLQPAWVAPHNNLARLYIETNRTKKAFESFDRAIELDPKIPHAYSGRGVLWAREKEYDKAIADFNLALKNDDKFLEAYGGLSSVYEQKKQYADAVKWGKTALRHDPKSVETHCRLGATYSEWGRHEATNGSRKLATEMFDKAIDHSNEAIRLDANSGEAWYCLGNASRNRGQIRAAIAALEKAIVILDGVHSKKGIKADAHFNLGNNYRRLGDYLKAIDAYRAAIGANPDRAQAYANLGTTLLDQGNFDEAQKMYADALARDKKSLENNINFAVALDRQGRYSDALAFLQGCLEKLEGGEGYKAEIDGLIGFYERLVRLQKQLPAILGGEKAPADADLLQLAEICNATKDYAAAARFYREVFAKQPGKAASLQDGYRFAAARAAACASHGLDKGAALTPEDQTLWRKQALDWLRADLSLWGRNAEKGPMPVTAVLQALQRWRHHVDLAGIRGAALDKLEPGERDDWHKFWVEVDSLLKRIPIP